MTKNLKKLFLILASISILCLLCSCTKANEETKKEAEKYLDSASAQVENNELETSAGVFLLKNELGTDIYSIDFTSGDKEDMEIDAVLPDGNEVSVAASGEWELICKISLNGEYVEKSFGVINFDEAKVVTLKLEDGKYFALCD